MTVHWSIILNFFNWKLWNLCRQNWFIFQMFWSCALFLLVFLPQMLPACKLDILLPNCHCTQHPEQGSMLHTWWYFLTFIFYRTPHPAMFSIPNIQNIDPFIDVMFYRTQPIEHSCLSGYECVKVIFFSVQPPEHRLLII